MRRPIVIFGLGFGALFLGAAVLSHPFHALMCFAGAILMTVTAGFLLQPKSEYALTYLGGLTNREALLVFDNQEIGAEYPQLLVFAVHLRRLWLLGIVTFTSLGFLVIAPHTYLRNVRDVTLHYSVLWAVNVGLLLFTFAAAWVRERWILFRSTYRLGIVYNWIKGYCAYEFVGLDGLWTGGSYEWNPWNFAPLSNLAPVLISERNPEQHMPATACIFHQFELIDRRHLRDVPQNTESPVS